MKNIFDMFYDNLLTIIGDIKLFRYPMFIVYDPSEYLVTGEDTRKIIKEIQPGDILLRCYTMYLDGFFIPGAFSHAAFYAGNGVVIHAVAEGIKKEDLFTWLRCDGVAVLRFKEITSGDLKTAIEKSYKLLGKEYDFEFESGDDKFYCSEAVREFYDHKKSELKVEPQVMKALFGLVKKFVIQPDAYMKTDALKLVYANSYAKKRIKKYILKNDD